jgi:hypothetical protein
MVEVKVPVKQSRNYGSNYWEVYSLKLSRLVRLFSDLEYDNYILTETNPEIISFCEQPKKISINYNNKQKHSIFDMWQLYKDNNEYYCEVKYSKSLNPENRLYKKNMAQITAQKRWCELHDYNYKLLTENEIRSNMTYLYNMKTILFYLRNKSLLIDSLLEQVLHIAYRKVSIKSVLYEIKSYSNIIVLTNIAWHIFNGKLSHNLKKETFSYQTEVCANV